MSLFLITLPIFLLIALGYVLRMFRTITRDSIHSLNNFVYYISLPAIILVSFWSIDWFDADTRSVLFMNTTAVVGFAGVLFLFLKILPLKKRTKAGLFVASLVGNTVYMGFPIGQRALGDGIYDVFLAAATPHLVIGIAVSVLAIEWYLLRSHSPIRYVKDFVFNPLIMALVAGILLSVSQVSGEIIEILKQSLGMLAATASPIALVTLGAFLYGVFEFRLAGLALIASILKLTALPLAVFGVGHLFSLESAMISASVLAAAMPTAVTSFVIAEKYNAMPRLVASTLFMSTAFSLITITVALFLLS